MCLQVTSDLLIAEKDIVCYVVRKKYDDIIISPFQEYFQWKINKTYIEEEKIIGIFSTYAKEGFFHSCKYKKDALLLKKGLPYWKFPWKATIFKAIIPKKSKYFKGKIKLCDEAVDNKEGFASKKLKLIEEIK